MTKDLVINNRSIGKNKPPYIIAEMSANHNGSIERAIETIKTAALCGADAIKMQTYTAETMTLDINNDQFIIKEGLWKGYKLFDLYKWAETPYEWHEKLFSYANSIGITIFSTPFDESAVDLLESLNVPAYKIASFELIDIPLIKYIARKKKPMIMSTGMSSESEIQDAINAAKQEGNNQIALLHCISSYPTPIEKSNLMQIKNLEKKFSLISGLSDHTLGTNIAVTSIGLGASIIEKHFTLDRKNKGPDSDFSIEPNELQELCRKSKEAWLALGKEGFSRDKIEVQNKLFRRSIYFIKNKNAGEKITQEDIKRIRPGYGLPPKFESEIIGKILKFNVKKGQPTNWDLFYE